MEYIKRNPDGTLGGMVETPGHHEPLRPELLAALEAITELERQIGLLHKRIDEQQEEITALKGGAE
ncbi:hypothetical protein [Brevibacillus laterosporus]|uniref:Uncharacterized protein n=1 Tax=Brevibacillus laterosporus TaxID=1465 RepID=A0AAP3GA73_BRELA|nr:hypothetical protein [Brevibacillus laterosporus]AYB39669.1 hypothetical protein D5F52_16090 [Brevibacillus laterosporus]MBM7109091.1 hypothetical protein [Brevibacillus laterosporus]MCR8983117.1 hypothetical protein [Brevibacillus laterosporus]MCZ0810273.1 hypothetical protein [Brevibacillus laterosporus]MCZ0828551.1 hypothetical protein [Brevibacillus laterosporus]